jgi:hypothetical protein
MELDIQNNRPKNRDHSMQGVDLSGTFPAQISILEEIYIMCNSCHKESRIVLANDEYLKSRSYIICNILSGLNCSNKKKLVTFR